MQNPAEVITLAVAVAIAGAAIVTAGNSATNATVTADGHSTTQSGDLDARQLTGPYVSGRSSARASVKGLDDGSQSGSDVTAGPQPPVPDGPGSSNWVGSPSVGLGVLSPWGVTGPLAPIVSKPPSQLAGGGAGGAGRGDATPGRGADSTATPSTPSRPDATVTPSPSDTTAPSPEPSTDIPPTDIPPTDTPPVTTPPEATQPATTPTGGEATQDPGAVTAPDAGQATASPTASAESTNSQSPLTLTENASVPADAALNPVQSDRLP